MRLLVAIVSTALEEIAFVLLWQWVLPYAGVDVPLPVLIFVMVVWAAYAVFGYIMGTHALQRKCLTGLPTMVECTGKVVQPLSPEGMVKIRSELWNAESIEDIIHPGEEIVVVSQEGLKLFVRRNIKH